MFDVFNLEGNWWFIFLIAFRLIYEKLINAIDINFLIERIDHFLEFSPRLELPGVLFCNWQ